MGLNTLNRVDITDGTVQLMDGRLLPPSYLLNMMRPHVQSLTYHLMLYRSFKVPTTSEVRSCIGAAAS